MSDRQILRGVWFSPEKKKSKTHVIEELDKYTNRETVSEVTDRTAR